MGLSGISIFSHCRLEIPPIEQALEWRLDPAGFLAVPPSSPSFGFSFVVLTAASGTAFAALVRGETEVSDCSLRAYHGRQIDARKEITQALE